jgi:uncharacterized protein (DUF58 family)
MSRLRTVDSVPVSEVASRADVLRRLELDIRRRIDGLSSGDHATMRLGPGSERAQARPYEPGDDARLIDWNLTARSSQTFVRQTEAEQELETWIVADRSASLDFGTALCEKRDVVLGAVAAAGMLNLTGGNRIGVVVTGGDSLVHRPARQGRTAFTAALASVFDSPRQQTEPGPNGDLLAGLRWVAAAARRHGRVVIVSDFIDASDWTPAVRRLSQRHDVLCIHVTDPREFDLPNVGIIGVVDVETGQQRYVNTRSTRLREEFASRAKAQRRSVEHTIRSAGANYLQLSTDRDWLTDVVGFVAGQRSASTRGPHLIQRSGQVSR